MPVQTTNIKNSSADGIVYYNTEEWLILNHVLVFSNTGRGVASVFDGSLLTNNGIVLSAHNVGVSMTGADSAL
jgi:hypothetical protein